MSFDGDAAVLERDRVSDTCVASIIVPTFNGAERIGKCLEALLPQALEAGAEILVVDDGSTDDTAMVVSKYPGVRIIIQANAGPASARNHGAIEASGSVVLFTDDDCVPTHDWLTYMLRPFSHEGIVGAKGTYRTMQQQIAARFVQAEYEDKYRFMSSQTDIDFIDTYSGAYDRDRFLEMKGYDTSFPVACAEDVELSYRMSAKGWKMKFVPEAVVYHTHPATFWSYLKKKYKFAYWRMLAVRKNPGKALADSHTPQLMKFQLLFLPALLVAVSFDLMTHPRVPVSMIVSVAFFVTTMPFAFRAFKKDPFIGIVSPVLLAARGCAQFAGVFAGAMHAALKGTPRKSQSAA